MATITIEIDTTVESDVQTLAGVFNGIADLLATNSLTTYSMELDKNVQAALIREAKAEALEEFAGQMATGFNPQTLNAERRAIKREARTRAAEYREGSER